MMKNRRFFLKTAGAMLALSLTDVQEVAAREIDPTLPGAAPVNVIIPKNYAPPSAVSPSNYRRKLTNAILSYLEANYGGSTLPVWRKNFSEIDLEKRVYNISYWLLQAVQTHKKIYPLDPVWIMAMIMKESYFYEFAVSSSLAVGICQFVQPTAEEYDMLCASTKPAHHRAPFKKPHLASRVDQYYDIRSERRKYRRNNRPAKRFTLEETLEIISSGDSAAHKNAAAAYLAYIQKSEDYNTRRRQARDEFKEYLQANVEGRSIFNDKDLQFILGFDERFTYKKPIHGMVKMMARALRARNGNILAASVGYNAGLSTTKEEDGVYKLYGKIPAIEQSTQYLSHVLVNHFEIMKRM